jgi:small multidrug resistance family-3 protein
MTVAKSVTLFVLAAIAEIGGAWADLAGYAGTPRPGVDRRRHRGTGGVRVRRSIAARHAVRPHLGRVWRCFVARSLAWGMALDGFRPDRWDLIGACVCLLGAAVIMYAPRVH